MTVNKSLVMDYHQCPKKLWLHHHRPELDLTRGETSIFQRHGFEFGGLVSSHFSDGVTVSQDTHSALEQTRSFFQQQARRPIFEAAFEVGGLLVRTDILVPVPGGWQLIEVKASTSLKPYHLLDTAIQAWVVEQVGIPLVSMHIAHVNSGFELRSPYDYSGLASIVDVTSDVCEAKRAIPRLLNETWEVLNSNEPLIGMGKHCAEPYPCPFKMVCMAQGSAQGYPPEMLPRVKKLPSELRAEGYNDLRNVPEGRLTNPRHIRMWRALRSGHAELDPEAGRLLNSLPFPRYYLDFETIQFSVPKWAGTSPYQQIPFQWSCHIEVRPGDLSQTGYLSESYNDPRREFAESLVRALGEHGPIFVYNATFECKVMSELADTFPDLSPHLQSILSRIVDLLKIAEDFYYHPAMGRSWSIKKVLPTIAPDLAYDDLDVADGSMAQMAFMELIDGQTSRLRREEIRRSLLEYCGRDTYAMVRIAHYFQGIL